MFKGFISGIGIKDFVGRDIWREMYANLANVLKIMTERKYIYIYNNGIKDTIFILDKRKLKTKVTESCYIS